MDVIAQPEQAPVSAGICEIWASAPVEFEYDSDRAVCYMLEGHVTLTEGETRYDFEPGDVVYIPQQAGLKVSWDTSLYGRFFYVNVSALAVARLVHFSSEHWRNGRTGDVSPG